MKINKESKISTPDQPCNADINYKYYQCFESYFYKKRGCQYSWNVYSNLTLPICDNFTRTEDMVNNMDRNMGFNRYTFTHSERMTRTKMQCPPPCRQTFYNLAYGPWDVEDFPGIIFKSIQIGFSNFMIVNAKQYLACDLTCIIGQLGGNLGFFLGGSLLAGMDFFLTLFLKMCNLIEERRNRI